MSPESPLRLTITVTLLLIFLFGESLFPRRPRRTENLRRRKIPNLAIGVINALALGISPITAVGASLFAIFNHIGVFLILKISLWPSIILSLILLDLAIYWQHRLFHAIPPLWRIHRMHHTDIELDATTALRFHPVEIFISAAYKAAIIILLGAPLLAVIAFEIILNALALFNHANLRLPPRLDAILRLILVTPDMHRIHHSVRPAEHNANYGFNLSIWDRLFSSYLRNPAEPHATMKIGQPNYRATREANLASLLTQPFRPEIPPK